MGGVAGSRGQRAPIVWLHSLAWPPLPDPVGARKRARKRDAHSVCGRCGDGSLSVTHRVAQTDGFLRRLTACYSGNRLRANMARRGEKRSDEEKDGTGEGGDRDCPAYPL